MSTKTVCIIDYGSGNLRSAAKAFEHVISLELPSFRVLVTSSPEDVRKADYIVLPGQGAFGDCMNALQRCEGMVESLEEAVLHKGKPYLGICVGMQLMVSRGHEHGVHPGLNWIEGEVVPLAPEDTQLKIPHMGWNQIITPGPTEQDNAHFVLRSIESYDGRGAHYYFVHSFMVQCKYKHDVIAVADYGGFFPAVIGRDNMIGVQFHPEKSQKAGLDLLAGFLKWRP